MFAEQARQYIKDSRSLEPSLASLYNVVWGQCSRLLQNKLKSSNKYNEFDNNCDVASLLTEIKKLSSKLEENTSAYDALRESKVKFYRYQQSEEETLADHMRNFKDLVSSVKYHGGDIFFDRDMMENEFREDKEKNIIKATPEGYRNRTIEKSKAVAFIKSANKKKYGRLLTNIRDQQSFKIDVYPKTLAEAYKMLSAHTVRSITNMSSKGKKEAKSPINATTPININTDSSNTGGNERSYLQTEVVPGTDGRTITHITCYNCNKKGHYSDNCPDSNTIGSSSEQHVQFTDDQNNNGMNSGSEEEQMLQMEGENSEIVHFLWTQLTHIKSSRYLDTDILLDTGSTFSVFKNQDMLLNVRKNGRTLKAFTNGGRQDSD